MVLALDRDAGVVWRRVSPLAGPHVAPQETEDARMFARIHPEDIHAVIEAWEQVAGDDGQRRSLGIRMQDLVDPDVWMAVDVIFVGVEPRPDGVVGMLSARFGDGVPLELDAVESEGFSVAASAPVGLALYTSGGILAWANPRFEEMVGREAGATTPSERVEHPVIGVLEQLGESWSTPGVESVAPEVVLYRGRTLRIEAQPTRSGDELLISVQDISQEMELSAARARADATFTAAFDHSLAGIAILTLAGVFTQVNPAFTQIVGYPEEELLGRTFDMITHLDDVAKDRARLTEMLAGNRPSYQLKKRYLHREGGVVWADLRVAVINDLNGRPLELVTNIVDISDRELAEAQLRSENDELTHRATHDHLTGLPNRLRLERVLERLDPRSEEGLFVLACDLDWFKSVNDEHGHHVGDLVLIEVARRLSDGSREGDLVVRMGGDEFVVLARVGADPDRAVALGERLVTAIRRPFLAEERSVEIGLSVGISQVSMHADVLESLKAADRAAMEVKRAGGGAILLASG